MRGNTMFTCPNCNYTTRFASSHIVHARLCGTGEPIEAIDYAPRPARSHVANTQATPPLTPSTRRTALSAVPAYRPIPKVGAGSPANSTQLSNAQALYANTGVDYPVSGDETLRHSGYGGIRQRHINLWDSIELYGSLSTYRSA